MARKTKAELNAEREAYEEAQRVEREAAYPMRLMAALEEATKKNNYELTVVNSVFVLRDRDASRYDNDPAALSYVYTENSQNALENLEWDMKVKAEERAESERLSNLRRQAFLKLSQEEKDALGLNDRNNW